MKKLFIGILCAVAMTGSSFGIVNIFTAVDRDWSKTGNWSLGELPGATATNHAVVQTGVAVLTNDFVFSNATLTIIRGVSMQSVLASLSWQGTEGV